MLWKDDSPIKFKSYTVSDNHEDVINLLKSLKEDSEELFRLIKAFLEVPIDKDKFEGLVETLNCGLEFETLRAAIYFLVSKLCYGSIMRRTQDKYTPQYSKKTSLKINFKKLKKYSQLLIDNDVNIMCKSYEEVETSRKNVLYVLDPPYYQTWDYDNKSNYYKLNKWLETINLNDNFVILFNNKDFLESIDKNDYNIIETQNRNSLNKKSQNELVLFSKNLA